MGRSKDQARERLEALATMLADSIKDDLTFIDDVVFTLVIADTDSGCTACVSNMDRKDLMEQMRGIAGVLDTPEAEAIDDARADHEQGIINWPGGKVH